MYDDLIERDPKMRKIREESRLKGQVEALQRTLVSIIRRRYPPLTELAQERVVRITKPDTLDLLLEQVDAAPDEAATHLILSLIAEGKAVTVVPLNKELTTQEAADILNVSRPHLVKLLERGEIPFAKTGTHRRIRFSDLMKYKEHRDFERRRGMAELTQLSQELGLYNIH